MACDSQLNMETVKLSCPKVFRLPCGGLIGAAGDGPQTQALTDWLQKGQRGERPRVTKVHALIAWGSGRVALVCNAWPPVEINGPCAIGAGAQGAMVAMRRYGASPREAIEAVMTTDQNTGGEIQVFTVERKRCR